MATIEVRRAHALTLDGVPRAATSIQSTTGLRAFVATADSAPLRQDGTTYPGRAARVTVGDPTDQRVAFNGEVDDDSLKLWPNSPSLKCSGLLGRTQRATGHQDTTAPETSGSTVLDEVGDVVLYPQYYATNRSDQDIVSDLLNLCGIAEKDIQGSGQLFGTIEPVVLGFAEAPWRLISDLDRLTGYRTFDDPAGVVRRVPWLRSPSGTTAYDFSEGVDVLEADRARSRRPVRNRVVLTGLDQLGTRSIPFTPTGVAQAPAPLDPDTGRPVIPTPPEYQSETWSTPLAETQQVCQDYCERRLGELNRVEERLTISIGGGRPGVAPGMTVGVASPHLDYDGRWAFFVEQVQQRSDGTGLHTVLDLLALVKTQGTNPNQRPVAVIALAILEETLADGSTLAIVQADGSASYDPDGEVVSYAWSGSVAPVAVGVEGKTATYVYTGGYIGQTITLTVLDNFGLSGSLTRTLSASSAPVTVRDLISAEATRLQASRDGERTWVDIVASGSPIPAIGVCEIGADAYTFAWTAAALYKVGEDNVATLVPDVADVTACWITESLAGAKAKDRVWAVRNNGQVWFSQGAGDPGTWTRLADLPGAGACNAIQESAFQDGDVYATRGNVLYHSYDRAGSWQALRTHPNAALIGSRIASGFGKLFAAFGGGADADAATPRVLERQNVAIGDFPSGDKPANPTGMTYAVFKDVGYLIDIAADGTTGRAWLADWSTASYNWVRRTYDTTLLGLGRHMIRDGSIEVVYGAADKTLWKAFGDLSAYYVLKDFTAPVAGKMIGYGRARAQPRTPAGLIASCWYGGAGPAIISYASQTAGPHKIVERQASGVWRVLSTHPDSRGVADFGVSTFDYNQVARPLLHVAGDVYLTWACPYGGVAGGWSAGSGVANVYRSTDRCATWAGVAALASVTWVERAIDGALYALADNGARIAKSTDQGASWATVHGAPPGGGGIRWYGLACDPKDAGKASAHAGYTFGILASDALLYTTADGFATISAGVAPYNFAGASFAPFALARLPGGAGTAWYHYGGSTSDLERAVDGATSGTLALAGEGVGELMWRAGEELFAIQRRSVDDGYSWGAWDIGVGDTPAQIALDAGTGRLLVGLLDGRRGSGTPAVTFQRRAASGTGWEDLTGNMASDLAGVYVPHLGGLVGDA